MPPKMVPCLICNLMVPKAQTVARADGNRVCRSHPGVEEMAQKLRDEERQRRDKEVCSSQATLDAKMRKQMHGYSSPFGGKTSDQIIEDAKKFREEAYAHCWTCGREGISLREYFAQCLIAHKRLQLRGEWNFLTLPEDMAELMGFPVVLACLPYDAEKDRRIYRDITNRRLKDIIHFLRFVNMCFQCIDKHKVRDRLEALMPKPTWEQLEAMMPVVVALDPFLEALAEKKENEN